MPASESHLYTHCDTTEKGDGEPRACWLCGRPMDVRRVKALDESDEWTRASAWFFNGSVTVR